MLSWSIIGYGAALSAVLGILLALIARERNPLVLVAVAIGAGGGPIAWNAILRVTRADEFFVDAPIPAFPISWQDTGSGVFALGALTLTLAATMPSTSTPRRVAGLALFGAISALLVDIYLY